MQCMKEIKVKPHNCSICDYSFTTEGNLNNHIDTIHEGFNNYGI